LSGHNIDAIYSSDLSRAKDTADEIAKYHKDVPVQVTQGLRPWHLGNLTGQHSADVVPILAEAVNNPDKPVDGGESFHDFSGRFFNTLDQIKREHGGETVAIVSHHRNDRLLTAAEQGNMQQFLQRGIKPGGVRETTI
jgi:probable phosphoglycerate mutase